MWVALAMMVLLLVKYRIKLNYFHGSMLVMQHMRAALVRKYLTLSSVEHTRHTNLRYEFQTAMSHTALTRL